MLLLKPAARAAVRRAPGWRLWARAGLYAALALLGLETGARWLLASCVVFSPHAWRLALPSRTFELPPELARRRAVRLEVEVGPPRARLAAWVIEPERAVRGTVVLLHGVRLDRRSLVQAGQAFADAGYRSVLVDLRGHGESTGTFLTYGAVEARDLSQLLDALETEGLALGCVGAFGFSYGAAVAVALGARDERVEAVVAVAPFASLRDVVADYRREYLPTFLNAIPARWFDHAIDEASRLADFDPDRSAPLQQIAQSRAHELLIHGTADTQIPLRHSLALASRAGPLAELWAVPGASHHLLPSPVIHERALAWFERWLQPAPAQGCRFCCTVRADAASAAQVRAREPPVDRAPSAPARG
ncbi:MAG: alpha/beta fold hydrolase [Deltaproteobacteria bacterium]